MPDFDQNFFHIIPVVVIFPLTLHPPLLSNTLFLAPLSPPCWDMAVTVHVFSSHNQSFLEGCILSFFPPLPPAVHLPKGPTQKTDFPQDLICSGVKEVM